MQLRMKWWTKMIYFTEKFAIWSSLLSLSFHCSALKQAGSNVSHRELQPLASTDGPEERLRDTWFDTGQLITRLMSHTFRSSRFQGNKAGPRSSLHLDNLLFVIQQCNWPTRNLIETAAMGSRRNWCVAKMKKETNRAWSSSVLGK